LDEWQRTQPRCDLSSVNPEDVDASDRGRTFNLRATQEHVALDSDGMHLEAIGRCGIVHNPGGTDE
jgi:hypothetical protein